MRRGLAESRTQAQSLIDAGRVLVGGAVAAKAAHQVDAGDAVRVTGDPPRYVGRGAEKLLGALETFGLDPRGATALDAGASTGGFTDVLLQHGATSVVALDVGHGQLHERLRADERVIVMERTNLRHVDPEQIGPLDVVVADLSFISLTVVMDVLVRSCAPGGWIVVLVKPQFEAGRREVSKGRGVITDPAQWRSALERVVVAAEASGASVDGLCRSPIHGADGNVEFLLLLTPSPVPDGAATGTVADEHPVPSTAAQSWIDAAVPVPLDDPDPSDAEAQLDDESDALSEEPAR